MPKRPHTTQIRPVDDEPVTKNVQIIRIPGQSTQRASQKPPPTLMQLEQKVAKNRAEINQAINGRFLNVDALLEGEKRVSEYKLPITRVCFGPIRTQCHQAVFKHNKLEIMRCGTRYTPGRHFTVGIVYEYIRSVTISVANGDLIIEMVAKEANRINGMLKIPGDVWFIGPESAKLRLLMEPIHQVKLNEIREYLIDNIVIKKEKELKIVHTLPLSDNDQNILANRSTSESASQSTPQPSSIIDSYSKHLMLSNATSTSDAPLTTTTIELVKEDDPENLSNLTQYEYSDLDDPTNQMRRISFISNEIYLGNFKATCQSCEFNRETIAMKNLANGTKKVEFFLKYADIINFTMSNDRNEGGSRLIFIDLGVGLASKLATSLEFCGETYEFNENHNRIRLALKQNKMDNRDMFQQFVEHKYQIKSGRKLNYTDNKAMEDEFAKSKDAFLQLQNVQINFVDLTNENSGDTTEEDEIV